MVRRRCCCGSDWQSCCYREVLAQPAANFFLSFALPPFASDMVHVLDGIRTYFQTHQQAAYITPRSTPQGPNSVCDYEDEALYPWPTTDLTAAWILPYHFTFDVNVFGQTVTRHWYIERIALQLVYWYEASHASGIRGKATMSLYAATHQDFNFQYVNISMEGPIRSGNPDTPITQSQFCEDKPATRIALQGLFHGYDIDQIAGWWDSINGQVILGQVNNLFLAVL